MDESQFDSKILEKIVLLEKKYKASGQDMLSYLEGLQYANYLTYWDYINLDVLLSLQQPKTSYKDEKIFIIYHQITELYFKLIVSEMEQIGEQQNIVDDFFIHRLERINMYYDQLISSFAMMWKGMDQEQFLKFRMSLLPSSGFQSAQYREIELMATDGSNLVALEKRAEIRTDDPTDIIFENLYWQRGAIELSSGEKTLTLKNFESKYRKKLMDLVDEYRYKNIWQQFKSVVNPSEALVEQMKQLDLKANVFWPLAHYKSTVKFLHRDTIDIAATGGTNWQKYLPPRFQKVIFFPELWSESEKSDWGKGWVTKEIFDH
jgi:tryptophan 2,3-dioxygenase